MASAMGEIVSVSLAATASQPGRGVPTGIGKVPAQGPERVAAPGPAGTGGSGLAGDTVCDLDSHGGDDQAVYAYAREDLDWWEGELGRDLPDGLFGENLTVRGAEVTGALVGERWRVGPRLVLEVAAPRIPCWKFAEQMREPRWVRRFTEGGRPGAYLRVLTPGEVCAGDRITVESRPSHAVTIGVFFQALTTHPQLLAGLLAAGDALSAEHRETIARRTGS